MTIKPRPGSGIYRRVDGGFTSPLHQVSGRGYLDGRKYVTPEEELAAEARQPQFTLIFDGNPPEDEVSGGFEVEEYLGPLNAMVVLAPGRPPFGEWEQLDEWPA